MKIIWFGKLTWESAMRGTGLNKLRTCRKYKQSILASFRNQRQFHVWRMIVTKPSMIDYNLFVMGIKNLMRFSTSYKFCGIIHVIYFFRISVALNCWSIMSICYSPPVKTSKICFGHVPLWCCIDLSKLKLGDLLELKQERLWDQKDIV